MKQLKFIFSLAAILLLLSACSSIDEDSKKHPEWIDSAQSVYPDSKYLTAVGEASTRTRAGNNALANLTEIFSVTVRAETKSITESVKQESAVGITMESATNFNRAIQTETEQAVAGVEIKETWLSEQGIYYALAVLDKSSAARNLRASIEDMDDKSAELIDFSLNNAPNTIASINALRSARDLQMSRHMANMQLKYIDRFGINSDISSDKIEQLIRQKLASLNFTVVTDNKRIKQSTQAGLAKLGVALSDDADIQVLADFDITEPSYINGWYWLRGSYELSVAENGQVVSSKRWPIKVSAQQEAMLLPRLQDQVSDNSTNYLQQLVSDSPTP